MYGILQSQATYQQHVKYILQRPLLKPKKLHSIYERCNYRSFCNQRSILVAVSETLK